MKSYLMIYLKWVMLSPAFNSSVSLWKNEQNSRMKEILKNSGLIPVNFQSTGIGTQMLYAIPAAFPDIRSGVVSRNPDRKRTIHHCYLSWQSGKGFQVRDKGSSNKGISVNHFHSYPLISGFIQYVSCFNHTFDDDLFLELSIHHISVS